MLGVDSAGAKGIWVSELGVILLPFATVTGSPSFFRTSVQACST